jgi:uncharacterized protein (DUF1684 family)
MDNFTKEILEWRETLETNLRKENSWLALVGLFWLEEGRNTFGAGAENDITFPDADIPAQIGAFIVDGDEVRLEVTADTLVDVDGVPAKEASLRPDISGSPTQLKLGALTFILIQREDGFGIRLWDNNSPQRESFPGRQWYPIDEAFRIAGRYERFAEERTVSFERRNGADLEAKVGGQVSFDVNGKPHTLLAFAEEEGDDLFIIFRDATNGDETYDSGRYLVVDAPQEGKAIIDFNRAYNPPCAFTPYATCPLPPAQNNLTVEINAGEKKLHKKNF